MAASGVKSVPGQPGEELAWDFHRRLERIRSSRMVQSMCVCERADGCL